LIRGAITIFDTDLVESIGLEIDFINGKAVRMSGIGGLSELCYQQLVSNAILGVDVMAHFGLKLDFSNLHVSYDH